MAAFVEFKSVCLEKKDEKGQMVEILKNLSFAIPQGAVFALAGPSGSGKSSALRLINRLDDASCGEIYIQGQEIKSWDISELRSTVGFMFQESALFDGTVMQNLLYGLCLKGLQKCDHEPTALELLTKVGLPHELLHRNVESLSGGQKQRVNLARTLALDPAIILMDEPTSSLDPAASRVIEQLIIDLNRESGKTFIIVSHNFEQIQRVASNCAILDQGEAIFTGTPKEAFASDLVDKLVNGEGEQKNA